MKADQHPRTQVEVASQLDMVERGARAFKGMLADITAQGDADLKRLNELEQGSKDSRDYRRMCDTVRAGLQRNLYEVGCAHADGFVRALTHLLSLVGDGAGPGDGWDPIHATGAAFEDCALADQRRTASRTDPAGSERRGCEKGTIDIDPIDVADLAREIAMRMAPDALLDSQDVAAMIKCEPRYVTEEFAKAPGFPKAYRLTKRSGRSQPRWKRSEIQSWIDSHKHGASKRGGRPRNSED